MHGHVPLLLLSCLNIMLELCAAAHCAQHLVMHVCLIHGYVCSTSVQDVKYIYIYTDIMILHYSKSDYTVFWVTYTNCKSSAVPQ